MGTSTAQWGTSGGNENGHRGLGELDTGRRYRIVACGFLEEPGRTCVNDVHDSFERPSMQSRCQVETVKMGPRIY